MQDWKIVNSSKYSLSCCTYVFHRCRFVLTYSVLAYSILRYTRFPYLRFQSPRGFDVQLQLLPVLTTLPALAPQPLAPTTYDRMSVSVPVASWGSIKTSGRIELASFDLSYLQNKGTFVTKLELNCGLAKFRHVDRHVNLARQSWTLSAGGRRRSTKLTIPATVDGQLLPPVVHLCLYSTTPSRLILVVVGRGYIGL